MVLICYIWGMGVIREGSFLNCQGRIYLKIIVLNAFKLSPNNVRFMVTKKSLLLLLRLRLHLSSHINLAILFKYPLAHAFCPLPPLSNQDIKASTLQHQISKMGMPTGLCACFPSFKYLCIPPIICLISSLRTSILLYFFIFPSPCNQSFTYVLIKSFHSALSCVLMHQLDLY